MRAFALAAAMALLSVAATPSPAAFHGRNGPLSYTFLPPPDLAVAELAVLSVTKTPVPPAFSRWECCSDDPGVTSADGRHHAETGRWRGRDAIKVLDRPGSGRVITRPPKGFDDSEPEWAPSGTSIVFARTHVASRESHIIRVGLDGTEQRLGVGSEPVWGANKRIAFVKPGARSGVTSVWTMRSNGTNRRRITEGADDRRPEWAPDGRTIAFNRGDDIMLVSARGGGVQKVTGASGTHVDPAFSPDGRRLAYATWNDAGEARIRIVRARDPHRTVRRLNECRYYCGQLDWLPALD
jgi:hypothetical protein